MPARPFAIFLVLILASFAIGCASNTENTPSSGSSADAPSEDPTNPTAMHLHDLAGQLILFQVENGKLPAALSQLDKRAGAPKPCAIDPASGKPYFYYADGPRLQNLPGRLVVCQSDAQPAGGRWCLLMNDYSSESQVLTYVQRVDESVFTRLKTGGGW